MTNDDLIMKVFFTYAWNKRKKKCECGCGKGLPKEINTACMDHILEKSKYPDCKYALSNIMFVTSECHTNKTNGFPNTAQKLRIQKAMLNISSIKKESSKFEETVKKKIWGKQQ